jgi:hypothetical protein
MISTDSYCAWDEEDDNDDSSYIMDYLPKKPLLNIIQTDFIPSDVKISPRLRPKETPKLPNLKLSL